MVFFLGNRRRINNLPKEIASRADGPHPSVTGQSPETMGHSHRSEKNRSRQNGMHKQKQKGKVGIQIPYKGPTLIEVAARQECLR